MAISHVPLDPCMFLQPPTYIIQAATNHTLLIRYCSTHPATPAPAREFHAAVFFLLLVILRFSTLRGFCRLPRSAKSKWELGSPKIKGDLISCSIKFDMP